MADSGRLRVVVFRVSDRVCAADVTAVREILESREATRIPGAAREVTGLINVRGELVPLVHGATLLGHDEDGSGGSILLMSVGSRTVAVVVDEVLDLLTLGESEVADRKELPGVDPRIVRGVGEHGGQSFVLLDLDALLGPILST